MADTGAYVELTNENPRLLETGFAAGMKELLKLGTGIGWIPQSLARDDIQRGDLIVLSQSYKRIHSILINPIYIGKIKHKTEVSEGLHEAILGREQFDQVQEQLQKRSVTKRNTHCV